jgi:hypothetical protein
MVILASAGGNSVPVIARLMQADEELMRFPVRCFAFDEFGPFTIRPHLGAAWTKLHPNHTVATRALQAYLRGATPTPATPTFSQLNGANAPASAANATTSGTTTRGTGRLNANTVNVCGQSISYRPPLRGSSIASAMSTWPLW